MVFLFLRLGEDGDDTGGDVRNTWDNGSRKRIGFWQDKARIGSRQLRQVEMAIMIFYLSVKLLSFPKTNFPSYLNSVNENVDVHRHTVGSTTRTTMGPERKQV